MAIDADAATERWGPAWRALVRTHARLWEQVETQMRLSSGLTMARYDVLMHLDMAGGRLRLTELAQAILLSPSGLSKLLDRMEAAGLIRREPDPGDARATLAAITPHGRAVVREARLRHHAWLQQAFGDVLDDRDVADLTRVMQRIAGSLSAPATAAAPGSG
jgi:DNA-binding MarR family transcriptional regulator